jgi:hypothetical protein
MDEGEEGQDEGVRRRERRRGSGHEGETGGGGQGNEEGVRSMTRDCISTDLQFLEMQLARNLTYHVRRNVGILSAATGA